MNDLSLIPVGDSEYDTEKFAKLLIRECMRVIEEEYDKLPCDNVYHTGIKNGVWQASEIISEHFGVER